MRGPSFCNTVNSNQKASGTTPTTGKRIFFDKLGEEFVHTHSDRDGCQTTANVTNITESERKESVNLVM
jgi:hypothetical protein